MVEHSACHHKAPLYCGLDPRRERFVFFGDKKNAEFRMIAV